ncbi:unnamed protein product [Cochlearia groenlandica]
MRRLKDLPGFPRECRPWKDFYATERRILARCRNLKRLRHDSQDNEKVEQQKEKLVCNESTTSFTLPPLSRSIKKQSIHKVLKKKTKKKKKNKKEMALLMMSKVTT